MSAKEDAKQALWQIVAAAGGTLHKKVALYKAFYYAHLFYHRDNTGYLTDYPIVRMPNGPGIDDASNLLCELEAENRVKEDRENYGPYPEYVYTMLEAPKVQVDDPRYQAIQQAVAFVTGKSSKELSDDVHDYSRSWQQGQSGEELNIYIDLLTEEEYNQVHQQLHDAEEAVNAVFSGAF